MTTLVRACLLGLTVVGLLAHPYASAACTQDNLTGKWFFYGTASDLYYGETNVTFRLSADFDASGNVKSSGKLCNLRDSTGKSACTLTSGKLTVGSACGVTGNIVISEDGDSMKYIIDWAKMSTGKNVMAGSFYDEADPDQVIFATGVKE